MSATVIREAPYPPIGDYALLSDCHSAALVSRCGSIDWCCMPRLDSPSCFGRLLDWASGGHFLIAPAADEWEVERAYRGPSLVLETRFRTGTGEARLVDAFAMREGGREEPRQQILRLVEGVAGHVDLRVVLRPRFEYAAAKPWIRPHGPEVFTLLGGSAGLLVRTDLPLAPDERDDALSGRLRLAAGERRRLLMTWVEPYRLYPGEPEAPPLADVEDHLRETEAWWRHWSGRAGPRAAGDARLLRSAVVLKGLVHARTGAIAAAATTSLPEALGGDRNWDYRMSWIRDSSFALESLAEIGLHHEAAGFAHFVQRTTAGFPDELQPMFGLDGRQLLPEIVLGHLEGYRRSAPVRIGNAASKQLQLDAMGELLDLAWRAAQRGDPAEPRYQRFLAEIVESVLERWREPDWGIWEVRSAPEHFVHSKVMCWAAVDRGIKLAENAALDGRVDRWRAARDEIRRAIESEGYDAGRGVFVRSFGGRDLDAALLLLPRVDFVAYDDPRMVRTVRAVATELREGDSLVRRYRSHDGLAGEEGAFVACSFWLAQCLALQGARGEAEELYAAACELGNDVGLFAEEHDGRQMLGNFPQGLSHYGHLSAAVALDEQRPPHEPKGSAPAGPGAVGREGDFGDPRGPSSGRR